MEMFIEKILSQNTNNTKVEMLDWFNRSVIGYDDNKQRFLVKVEKIKIEELNKWVQKYNAHTVRATKPIQAGTLGNTYYYWAWLPVGYLG